MATLKACSPISFCKASFKASRLIKSPDGLYGVPFAINSSCQVAVPISTHALQALKPSSGISTISFILLLLQINWRIYFFVSTKLSMVSTALVTKQHRSHQFVSFSLQVLQPLSKYWISSSLSICICYRLSYFAEFTVLYCLLIFPFPRLFQKSKMHTNHLLTPSLFQEHTLF